MAFTVYLPDEMPRTFDEDGAVFEVRDAGVLEVIPNASAESIFYGPAGWLRVEPGKPSGRTSRQW